MRCVKSPLIAVVLAGFVAGAGGLANADPVKIWIGWVVTPYEYVPIYFAHPGVAVHLGTSYTYEPIHYNSASLMIPAMATDELDIAPLTIFGLAAAIENAGMSDLRIIGDDYEDGVEGYHSDSFMVLNESPIRKVEDLKAKTVASFGIGSVGDTAIRAMLRSHGVADGDYNTLEAAPPNMKAMLLERKADLIPAVGIFAFDPELLAKARTLFTQRDALGQTASLLTARTAFLDANRAALTDFLEDMVRSVRWYSDPKNHKEVVDILARFTKQPPERYDSWVFTKLDAYHSLNGAPDLGALQGPVDRLRQMGFLKADLDLGKYAELLLVAEGAKRAP